MTHGREKLVVLKQPEERRQESPQQSGSPMTRVRGVIRQATRQAEVSRVRLARHVTAAVPCGKGVQ